MHAEHVLWRSLLFGYGLLLWLARARLSSVISQVIAAPWVITVEWGLLPCLFAVTIVRAELERRHQALIMSFLELHTLETGKGTTQG
jgi:hypothetical protein